MLDLYNSKNAIQDLMRPPLAKRKNSQIIIRTSRVCVREREARERETESIIVGYNGKIENRYDLSIKKYGMGFMV